MKTLPTQIFMAAVILAFFTPAASANGNCEQAHDNPPWCDLVGSQGPQGEPGEQGGKGDAGSKGDTGEQGAAGNDGQPGATGPKGPTGATGVQGRAGATGKEGATPLGSLSFTAAAFSIPGGKSGVGFGLSQGWNRDTIEGSIVLKKGWKDKPAGFVIGFTANDDGQSAFSGGIGFSF